MENYTKNYNWKEKRPKLESRIKTIVLDHLQLLSENFGKYFSQSLNQNLENMMWIINQSFYCRSPETNKSWRVDGNTGGITARFF